MMEVALSSSFIQIRHHRLLIHDVSSIAINVKRHHQPISITAYSSPQHDQICEASIRNPKKSIFVTILNKLDDLICDYVDLPLHPSIDPKHVLSGHCKPVDEVPPTTCQVVEGSLPTGLEGAYIRNGPNPQFFPKGPYHFFEGDGMLHMTKISQGKPTYCCRYVNTHRHAVEREIGRSFVPGIFSSFNGVGASMARLAVAAARVLTGQFNPVAHGLGSANATLALFAGHLFALCETDLPYAVRVTGDGDIETLGRHDFHTSEPFVRMTAHPKIDRATGEAFAYQYDVVPPFLTYFRIDPEGRKQKGVPILSMQGCACVHDFAVTQNYVVFPDTQVVVKPQWVLRGRSPVGVDVAKVPRLGVMPKQAEDERELWWVDVAGLNMMHCVNAWEEDGGATICVVATNGVSVTKFLENFHSSDLRMEKITIDVKGRKVQREPLSTKSLDLGVINPAYSAKKSRYVYAAVMGPKSWVGVVKLDLSLSGADAGRDYTVASRVYGSGCCGSEPYFVSREPNNPTLEEDDGYLLTYVHDESIGESRFLVMDAKSPTLEIIAAVKLPQRIPDGFHGLFVHERDLNKL